MGLFKKAKDAAQQAAQQVSQAGQQPPQAPPAQGGDGYVHVQGAGPIDPAIMGGPSTAAVAESDPIWQPINGISLQDYADLAKDAQARGINDEAGMITLAQEKGWDPADTKAALDGWVQRMGQSMAVGQQFRKFLGY
jgi:hypothetical protein